MAKAKQKSSVFLVEKVEMIAPGDLTGWDRNPRNNEAAVGPVAESIKAFGMLVPILVNAKNEVLAGNTRLKACTQLGLKKVPCVRVEHLTPAQQAAYNLADNKLGEIATWDQDMVREILTDLQKQAEELQFDFALIGYQEAELKLITDGWNSNAQRLSDIEADDSPAPAKIVVKCKPDQEEELRTLIQSVVNEAGMSEVTIS